MRASQLLVKLGELMNKSGEALYERVKLANQIRSDRVWLEEACAGDELKASEILAKYFPDVCHGRMHMLTLLLVFDKFPKLEQWRERKFNLIAMLDEIASSTDKEKVERRTAKLADIIERDEKIKELEYKLKRAEKTIEERDAEIAKLRQELSVMREDNARLEGRLEQLEKILDRESVAA